MSTTRRKRRLKKSFKIGIVIFLFLLMSAISATYYFTQIAVPVQKPVYGEVENNDANDEYGKINNPEEIQESTGTTLNYRIFNLKKGNCIFINIGDVEVLIDAGANNSEGKKIAKDIRNDVKDELDYVIATNSKANRIGGMPAIYKNYRVGTTFYNDKQNSTAQTKFEKAAEKSNYKKAKDENIKLGNAATLSIYSVADKKVDSNNASLIAELNYAGFRIAEIGELTEKYEARLNGNLKELSALVISKINTINFIDMVPTNYILISSPTKVPQKIVNKVENKEVYATYKHGDLILDCNGKEVNTNFVDKEQLNIRQ